jgi:hypothetical protein
MITAKHNAARARAAAVCRLIVVTGDAVSIQDRLDVAGEVEDFWNVR